MAIETKPVCKIRWWDSTRSILTKALRNRIVILSAILVPIFTTLFLVMWNKDIRRVPLPLPPRAPLNQLKAERLVPYKIVACSNSPFPFGIPEMHTVRWVLEEPTTPDGR